MPKAPEGTAAELVAAAMKLFGQKGFAATSTREIAAAADTNVASIAYHFGGKEGLRRACGIEVARRIGSVLGSAASADTPTPEAATTEMEATLRAMVRFVVAAHEADSIIPFMLREVADGGPILDAVYLTMIEPMHRHLCALWSAATGQDAESERTRLVVFSLIGQVLYFRIGRPIVTRRMGWNGIGPNETDAIETILIANLHTLIARERQS